MKANEVPEKIYLSYESDNEEYKDHIFIDYMWHRHPFEGKNMKNIEYTRTDAFIEKACDWLERNGSYYIGFEQGQPCVTEELIKSLKKYLEKQV